MTTFLITGATGRLGRAAAIVLRERMPTAQIRALTRDPGSVPGLRALGLTPMVGDYGLPATVARAAAGVDRMLLVSSPVLDPETRSAQHRAAVAAAVDAGVAHVVYTSAFGGRGDPGHAAAEDALAASGTGTTVLRNGLYTEPFVARAVHESQAGVLRTASAGQPIATASIRDLGEAAAGALIRPPRQVVWELRGPAWRYDELLQALSELRGTRLRSEEVSDAELGPFGGLFPLIRRGVFATETGDLAALLGREPEGIAAVAARLVRDLPPQLPPATRMLAPEM